MKAEILDEPELEFANGTRHIDIRFGLMHAGPLDVLNPRTRSISASLIGTTETVEGLSQWLERCRNEIPAKHSPYNNLFPRFPGFRTDTAFRSTILLESRMQRTISQRHISSIAKAAMSNEAIMDAVNLFIEELRYVAQNSRPDVVICAPPSDLWEAVKANPGASNEAQSTTSGEHSGRAWRSYDFHDLLKERAMEFHIPVQLVWPHTYDSTKRRMQKRRPERIRRQQDEATRAWNLHTALYYKAGGLPWRQARDSAQLTTCFVGISFYNSLDRDRLLTSVAQVFNERGEGVVVRGGQAIISKIDRQPHLDASNAQILLKSALQTYRKEHKTLPARVVFHKTSRFSQDELNGFSEAVAQAGIEEIDYVNLDSSHCRVFREGANAPLRGTFISLDGSTHILYTKGGVDFFHVYPGLYVPLPILIRCAGTEQTPRFLASEIFALTKMNWNTTQFDGRDPITIRAAREVGAILPYFDESAAIEPRYSHYI